MSGNKKQLPPMYDALSLHLASPVSGQQKGVRETQHAVSDGTDRQRSGDGRALTRSLLLPCLCDASVSLGLWLGTHCKLTVQVREAPSHLSALLSLLPALHRCSPPTAPSIATVAAYCQLSRIGEIEPLKNKNKPEQLFSLAKSRTPTPNLVLLSYATGKDHHVVAIEWEDHDHKARITRFWEMLDKYFRLTVADKGEHTITSALPICSPAYATCVDSRC